MKKWKKPKLIILVREDSDKTEYVLSGCKNAGDFNGPDALAGMCFRSHPPHGNCYGACSADDFS